MKLQGVRRIFIIFSASTQLFSHFHCDFFSSKGIIISIVWATILSVILKLLACTLQQKLIGEYLQGFVSVRKFIGINSTVTRSVRHILSEKGLSFPKVCILIGGPDWPTSVTCGIMNLSLFPILVGTLPIVILIFPTVLTGSFLFLRDRTNKDGTEIYPWAEVAYLVTAMVALFVQFGSMLLAAYYVDRATSTNNEELDKIPIDEEVKLAEEKAEAFNEAFAEITSWSNLPILPKMVLTLSLFSIISSLYISSIFSTYCFAEYDLSSTVADDLDGNWTSLLLFWGWIVMILFLVSVSLLIVFNHWGQVS